MTNNNNNRWLDNVLTLNNAHIYFVDIRYFQNHDNVLCRGDFLSHSYLLVH